MTGAAADFRMDRRQPQPNAFLIAADGRGYVYSREGFLDDLLLVSGVR